MFDGKPMEIFRNHSQELIAVGMDVPQVFKLADLLRQRGLQLPENIKDEQALIKAIKKARGMK